MVYQGVLAAGQHHWVALVFLVGAIFGSALTLASFIKVLHSVFFGPAGEASAKAAAAGRGENAMMAIPMIVLAAACVLLGVVPQLVAGQVLAPVVGEALQQPAPQMPVFGPVGGPLGWWSPTRATALLLVALGVGVLLMLLTRMLRFRVGRTFLCGEIREEDPAVRVSGTEFYRTVSDLPLVGPMLRDGATEAYDAYRVIGQGGNSLVQVLRRVHTGVLPLYVTWVLAGLLAILMIVLQLGG
jgi:NADH:ubiquinone oxidoreductase subunit 5 (subunit L)/multisubunit Na+/H+ antiporter MnhA subunit